MDISGRINPGGEKPSSEGVETPESLVSESQAEQAATVQSKIPEAPKIPKTEIESTTEIKLPTKEEVLTAARGIVQEKSREVDEGGEMVTWRRFLEMANKSLLKDENINTRDEKIIPKLPLKMRGSAIIDARPILIPSCLQNKVEKMSKGFATEIREKILQKE